MRGDTRWQSDSAQRVAEVEGQSAREQGAAMGSCKRDHLTIRGDGTKWGDLDAEEQCTECVHEWSRLGPSTARRSRQSGDVGIDSIDLDSSATVARNHGSEPMRTRILVNEVDHSRRDARGAGGGVNLGCSHSGWTGLIERHNSSDIPSGLVQCRSTSLLTTGRRRRSVGIGWPGMDVCRSGVHARVGTQRACTCTDVLTHARMHCYAPMHAW